MSGIKQRCFKTGLSFFILSATLSFYIDYMARRRSPSGHKRMSRERYDALHLRLGFPKVPMRILRPILHYLVVFIASDGCYRMSNSACEMLFQCIASTCKLVIPGLNTEITSVRLEAIDQSRLSQ